MRWSQTLIPTQKQDPADAVIASHKLLIRGGFIKQLQAGCYTLLPLGLRCLHKAQAIVREEMNAAGAVEMLMPALQPAELWEQTGRIDSYGANLMTVTDRHGRKNVLGPTHEEVVTTVVGSCIESYKQLPVNVYQIQTKFRDEFRPRYGLLRVREFTMKDAYSFAADAETLDRQYQEMYDAYERIFARCGVPVDVVEADSGPIGGSASHEFMAPVPVGEDVILRSDKGNYAANVEKAETGDRPWSFEGEPTGELEEVHTPGMSSIEEVGKFMKVKPKNMLKTLVFEVRRDDESEAALVLAVVRGDHDVNEAKTTAAIHQRLGWAETVELLADDRREQWGPPEAVPIGFIGPARVGTVTAAKLIFVDSDAAQSGFWATGAGKFDYHLKHFNWQRDVLDPLGDDASTVVTVADIRNAVEGDPSPTGDGGVLSEKRGVELGHVFKLGTKYSDALNAKYLGEDGERRPLVMGCYGIGVGRILLAAVEQFHDDRGIVWPTALAPFSVVVTPIKYDGDAKAAADRLHDELTARGIDVLLDDRDERPGSKFADADLIGIPLRITIGDRGLRTGEVEFKRRGEKDPTMVKLDDAAEAAATIVRPAAS